MKVIEYEWEQPLKVKGPDGSVHHRGVQYRAGSPWVAEEYEFIVEQVRKGATMKQLAAKLARSESAIGTRIKRMLPPEAELRPYKSALDALWDILEQNPEYDWKSALRQNGSYVIDYPTIRLINTMNLNDPSTLDTVCDIVQVDREQARSIIRRFTPEDVQKDIVHPYYVTVLTQEFDFVGVYGPFDTKQLAEQYIDDLGHEMPELDGVMMVATRLKYPNELQQDLTHQDKG